MLKLTVAIPNYNGGKNLEKAIISCKYIRLNSKEFEILVVDNCSSDNSLNILNTLKSRFPNIRVIRNKKNIGRIGNWNRCLKLARGKYILFLFTNDTINKRNNIHELIEILDKNPDISIAVSSFVMIENNKKYIMRKFPIKQLKVDSLKFISLCLTRGFLQFGPLQSIIFRLEDIKRRKNFFIINKPIVADQIFSFIEASKREYILFNHIPIINWIISKNRFGAKIKFVDQMKEDFEAIDIISMKMRMSVDYKLVATFHFPRFLKYLFRYFTGFIRGKGYEEVIKTILIYLSFIFKKKAFPKLDYIILRSLIEKIRKPKKEFFNLIYGKILERVEILCEDAETNHKFP